MGLGVLRPRGRSTGRPWTCQEAWPGMEFELEWCMWVCLWRGGLGVQWQVVVYL